MQKTDIKDYYPRRRGALINERSSFIPHYMEIARFIQPRRGRFLISDRNKGDKRWQHIVNSAATQATRVCVSGLQNGTMSPTRPWFTLEMFDKSLREVPGVNQYLFNVAHIIRTILNESNFYSVAPQVLEALILFGTAAMAHVDDFDDVARFYAKPVGSYCIAVNDRLDTDTFYEEFEWTVLQIVNKFGIDNVSQAVKNAAMKGDLDKYFPVYHFIEANQEFKPSSPWAKDKPFRQVYYEPSELKNNNRYLMVAGFEEFPVYAPRWETTGYDAYGTNCPGMTALGDIKGIQVLERDKARATQLMVNPPMQGPPSLKNSPITLLPGGFTTVQPGEGNQKIESIYNVNFPLREVREDILDIRRRIDKAFFVDLFLAISEMEGIQPRNELDLMTRNEERLLQLGPVLERVHRDFLSPLIVRVFAQANRAGILPSPPAGLNGEAIKIRYVSSLVMAQKAIATQSIDRYAGFVGNLMNMGFTDAKYKFNPLQAADEYGAAIGVDPDIIPDDQEVDRAMKAAAQQQQAAMAMEAMSQGAQAANQLAGADTDGKNALTDMMKNVQLPK